MHYEEIGLVCTPGRELDIIYDGAILFGTEGDAVLVDEELGEVVEFGDEFTDICMVS